MTTNTDTPAPIGTPRCANPGLMYQTLAHIEANPERWGQKHWVCETEECGTAYCFAGWALTLIGVPISPALGLVEVNSLPIDARARLLEMPSAEWHHHGRLVAHVSDVAQAVLGLEDDDADRLFDACNDLANLRYLVDELTGAVSS